MSRIAGRHVNLFEYTCKIQCDKSDYAMKLDFELLLKKIY